MLTRRDIRAKVLEAIYAQKKSNMESSLAEKILLKSTFDAFILYCSLLDLLLAISNTAENSIEIREKRHFKTDEYLSLRRKFIDNPIFVNLRNNDDLLNNLSRNNSINWKQEPQYVSNIWNQIRHTEQYKSFMSNPTIDQREAEKLLSFIYIEIIAENELLREYIEDRNMYWLSYLPVANTMILKTIKRAENCKKLIQVFKSEEDKYFMTKLFRQTIAHSTENRSFLDVYFKNWESSRVADIDFIAMEMALTEFLHFPYIPTKVTLNEYIELVSDYSTSKSKLFINGILDSALKDLEKKQKIKKSGRGLIN